MPEVLHRLRETPLKKDFVLEHLRARIVAGELSPGSRLPTRRDLERQFGVSTETVQRALERLIEDEFVSADGRRGTHVNPHPPHLSRYALVFRFHPQRDAEVWTRFNTALSDEARKLHRTQTRRIAIYRGVDGHSDSHDFQKLVREVQAQRLAGLIFADGATHLQDTPLLQSAMPRVGIGAVPQVAIVALDYHSFIDRALDYLAARGRRRVALMSHRHLDDELNRYAAKGAAARGLTMRPYWMQSVNVEFADAARNSMHLLMRCAERPDALIITDDNLVEHATAGLIAASTRVPEEVEVVAHCNFPYPTPAMAPVKHLGYDVPHILEACIECIDGQRRNAETPMTTLIPARFEEEVKAGTCRSNRENGKESSAHSGVKSH